MKEIDFVKAEDTKSNQSFQLIDGIIIDLRLVIDQLGKNFASAKNLILELARLLDETKQCNQSKICRKIKEILKDKIAEGKISEKWIEECLPQEYKRNYVKSELSSLSAEDDNENTKTNKIVIDTYGYGQTSNVKAFPDVSCNSTEQNESELTVAKPKLNIHSASGNQQISSSSSEIDCIRCEELEDALLRASSAVPADKLQNDCEKRYCIPKEKYDLLMAAMKNSQQFCSVIFDIEGTLVYAEPDISRGDDGI